MQQADLHARWQVVQTLRGCLTICPRQNLCPTHQDKMSGPTKLTTPLHHVVPTYGAIFTIPDASIIAMKIPLPGTGEEEGNGYLQPSINLDAGQDASILQDLDKRNTVGRALVQRLLKHDAAGDVIAQTVRCVEHLSPVPAVRLGVVHA